MPGERTKEAATATAPDGPSRPSSRPGPEDAIRVARRAFMGGQRVDVGAVASELGVNRSTVYRWFGGRDPLLVRTLWSLASDTLELAESRVTSTGRERLDQVMRFYCEAVASSPAYRHFLRNQPEAAARVLFTNNESVREHTIEAFERLLRSEEELFLDGVDLRAVAHAIVRSGEIFMYGEQIGRSDPRPDATMEVVRLILDLASADPPT